MKWYTFKRQTSKWLLTVILVLTISYNTTQRITKIYLFHTVFFSFLYKRRNKLIHHYISQQIFSVKILIYFTNVINLIIYYIVFISWWTLCCVKHFFVNIYELLLPILFWTQTILAFFNQNVAMFDNELKYLKAGRTIPTNESAHLFQYLGILIDK